MAEVQERLCERIELRQLSVFDGAAGLLPNLGTIEVEALDSVILQHAIMHWLKGGRIDGGGGLSQKTVRDILMILKMCLRIMEENRRTMPEWQVELPVRQ